MIDMLMMIFGYIVSISILLFVITKYIVVIYSQPEAFSFTIFGFGLVVARNDRMRKNLNMLRKTQNKKVFITAPEWFNRYVINIGGIKK